MKKKLVYLMKIKFFMSEISKIPLSEDESMIDSWDLYYTFTNGKSFFGVLAITTKRLIFESNSRDSIEEILSISKAFTRCSPCIIELKKDKIHLIDLDKKPSCKRIIIKLNNGETHILDRKLLSIDRIFEAIQRYH